MATFGLRKIGREAVDWDEILRNQQQDPFAGPSTPIREETPEPEQPFVGPVQPSESQRLQYELDKMDKKPSLKQALLQSIVPAASMIIGGLAGGTEGAAGAGKAITSNLEQERAIGENRRNRLMSAMQTAQQRESVEQQHQQTLAQQIAAQKQAAENARLGRETTLEAARISHAPKPGVDVPFAPSVFEQQKQLKAPTPVAGRDVPLSEAVFNQQKQLKTPALVPGRDIPLPPDVESQKNRIAQRGMAPVEETPIDSTSRSILAQTGLSYGAFAMLTGQSSKMMGRSTGERTQARLEAQKWANKHGVDISTLPSQYEANNTVLANTKIMEDEMQGTIQNLQGVVNDRDLKELRVGNVLKVWAGQEVNDDLAEQYAMHLFQLRNELAGYAAAMNGRSGNEINLSDQREAELIIKNGIAKGSLAGLSTAVTNSTNKMKAVMQRSISRAEQSVWDLFGVGKNYKSKNLQSDMGIGVKIRDPKTGKTGTYHGTTAEAKAAGYEVQ
jgi:hypothetical protein